MKNGHFLISSPILVKALTEFKPHLPRMEEGRRVWGTVLRNHLNAIRYTLHRKLTRGVESLVASHTTSEVGGIVLRGVNVLPESIGRAELIERGGK